MGLISRVSSRTYRKTKHPRRWRTLTVNEEEPDTCSLKLLGTRECQAWPPTCTSTNEATSLTSKVMVPSKRVCHTKSTTVKLVEFTTSPNTPSVSSLTNESEETSSPKGSTSESNTQATPNLDWVS